MADHVISAGTSSTTIQSTINSAARGDTITFDAAATFDLPVGLSLPVKSGTNDGTDANSVILRSSALASLVAGTRVSPANASSMAKLNTTDTSPVFTAASGAGGYKILGFEITNTKASPPNNYVVNYMLDFSVMGSYITVDRCLVHPQETPSSPPYYSTGRFAFAANGDYFSFTNNYIHSFYGLPYGASAGATAWDATGFSIDQSAAGGLIDNNYVESWFNGMQVGGSDNVPSLVATVSASPAPTLTSARLSSVTGLAVNMPIALEIAYGAGYCKRPNTYTCWGNGIVQSISGNDITFTSLIGVDNAGGGSRTSVPGGTAVITPGQAIWQGATVKGLTITRNHFHHPTAFTGWQFTNNGNHPKGFIELKKLEDGLIEGNLCDGYPSTIAFNGINQSGGCPWVKFSNVTVRHNWLKEFNFAFFSSLTDGYYYTTNGSNISFINNLATGPDLSGVKTGGIPAFIQSGKGGANVTYQHNTIDVGDDYTTHWGTWDAPGSGYVSQVGLGYIFKDNIIGSGNYGCGCAVAPNNSTACWPDRVEDQNLFVLNVNPPSTDPISNDGFSNSLTAANYAAVLWVNRGGSAAADWQLQSGSAGHSTATDGSDIGVNISAMVAAMSPTDQAEIGGGASPIVKGRRKVKMQ